MATIVEDVQVNWKQVGVFLSLTFGLTWLLDLVIYKLGGLQQPSIGLLLQFQMLLPAFSAIILGLFFFRNSPIHYHTHRTISRWFIYFYLLFVLLYLSGVIISFISPQIITNLSGLLIIPSILGLVLLGVIKKKGGSRVIAEIGLAGGKGKVWVIMGLCLVGFLSLESALNYLFGFGQIADVMAFSPQLASSGMPRSTLILSLGLNAVVIGPILGLIITFGEEYGWRGYLQSELSKLGKIRGTVLLGTIWGIWHWPVIWMGYNYPGQPILGSLLMVVFCIEMAFFLAYAVYKSKGLWIASYLHALSNQTMSFLSIAFITPTNVVTSFGLGIPGLLLGACFIALILRDPIWQAEVSE